VSAGRQTGIAGGGGGRLRPGPGAAQRAGSRVDYLEADPARNAQNAVKVMLKFLLLERQRIACADIAGMFESIPLVAGANRRCNFRRLCFPRDAEMQAAFAVAEASLGGRSAGRTARG
jgi:hypothetical protein